MDKKIVEKLKKQLLESDFVQKIKAFLKKVEERDFAFELSNRQLIVMICIVLGIFIGDQFTKLLADRTMMLGQSYEIIDNFFYFTYVYNEGMAWSLLSGHRWLFIIMTFIAIIGMAYFFVITKKHEVLTRYGIVLVFGGTLGNLVDRIFLGYVRDFIHFYIFGYDFPIFNVADIAVVLGMGLIILEICIQEYQIWKLSKSL